jgi:hypothetical protein
MNNLQTSHILNIMALGLLICHIVFHQSILLYLATLLLILIAFPNPVGRLLAAGWMRFGAALGALNSRVLLTIVYYLILVPVAYCYRRFNRGLVAYFFDRSRNSYFIDATRRYDRSMFEKIW